MEDHLISASREYPGHRRATAVASEVRTLEAQLLLVGPMKRRTLARAVHADGWPAGAFDYALTQAVRQGKILELPLDWLRAGRPRGF